MSQDKTQGKRIWISI